MLVIQEKHSRSFVGYLLDLLSSVSPACYSMSVFHLWSLKPDMRAWPHHGPLDDSHQPSMDLTHLSEREHRVVMSLHKKHLEFETNSICQWCSPWRSTHHWPKSQCLSVKCDWLHRFLLSEACFLCWEWKKWNTSLLFLINGDEKSFCGPRAVTDLLW